MLRCVSLSKYENPVAAGGGISGASQPRDCIAAVGAGGPSSASFGRLPGDCAGDLSVGFFLGMTFRDSLREPGLELALSSAIWLWSISTIASGVLGGSGCGCGSAFLRRGSILKTDFSMTHTLPNKSELTI
jgi:hypothetical protein